MCECPKTLLPAFTIILKRFTTLTSLPRTTRRSAGHSAVQRCRGKSSDVDLMAAFTYNLLENTAPAIQKAKQEHTSKTNTINTSTSTTPQPHQIPYRALLERLNALCSTLDVRKLSTDQLNELILNTFMNKDKDIFDKVLNQCVRYNVIPSIEMIKRLLPMLSISKYDNVIETTAQLMQLCSQQHPNVYDEHPALRSYRAYQLWHAGSTTDALAYLRTIYEPNDLVQRTQINMTYKCFVKDTLANHGDAVMQKLIGHATHIHDTYNDPSVLHLVWIQCFISEYFNDQQSAAELFNEFRLLREVAAVRTCLLVFDQLQKRNVDAVQRLIQQVKLNLFCSCGWCGIRTNSSVFCSFWHLICINSAVSAWNCCFNIIVSWGFSKFRWSQNR